MAWWQRAAAAGRTGRGAAGAGTTGEARLPKAPSALSRRGALLLRAPPSRSRGVRPRSMRPSARACHRPRTSRPLHPHHARIVAGVPLQTPRTQDVIRTQLWRAAFSVRFSKIVNAFARLAFRVLVCYRKCFRVSTILFSEACPPNSSYLYLFTTWVQPAVRRFREFGFLRCFGVARCK